MTKATWVVAGGRADEWGHCTRCGEGLSLGGSQRVEVALAALRAFTKAHAGCKPGRYTEPTPTRETWARSRDTGVSSATIYYVFTGQAIYPDFDVPQDPADFGRCYRLLKLAPEWAGKLRAVAERFPRWRPFVDQWPRLTEMYEQALVRDDGGAMYEFMQAIACPDPKPAGSRP